ncbi:MAG: nucleoside monophosphate kinase [bacterium]
MSLFSSSKNLTLNEVKKIVYKIIFFGPQASGKGTQADFLSKELNLPNISVGNLFRNNIKNQTEIGKIAQSYINDGNLVPPKFVNEMTISRLKEPDCKNGFILDGYPRNVEQFEAFEKFTKITHAIEIWISDEEAIKRLGGRRSCVCGEVYHIKYKPPKVDGICDKCGGKLSIRDDDTPEAIKVRLKIYHEETEPVIKIYQEAGVLIKIDGEKSIEDVSKEVAKEIWLSF